MESAAMRLRRHFNDQYKDTPGIGAASGFNAAVEVFVNCHVEEMITKAANLLIKAFHGKTYYTCGQVTKGSLYYFVLVFFPEIRQVSIACMP